MPIPLIRPEGNSPILTEYPQELPQLSEKLLTENPELRVWQNEMNSFWRDFRYCLSKERETLLSEIAKLQP